MNAEKFNAGMSMIEKSIRYMEFLNLLTDGHDEDHATHLAGFRVPIFADPDICEIHEQSRPILNEIDNRDGMWRSAREAKAAKAKARRAAKTAAKARASAPVRAPAVVSSHVPRAQPMRTAATDAWNLRFSFDGPGLFEHLEAGVPTRMAIRLSFTPYPQDDEPDLEEVLDAWMATLAEWVDYQTRKEALAEQLSKADALIGDNVLKFKPKPRYPE
jgi:hypothetical protein